MYILPTSIHLLQFFPNFSTIILQRKIHADIFVHIDLAQNLLLQFFEKNECSNIAPQKPRSKFLFPIFKHLFPFFSITYLKISISFRPKSYHQIKPPIGRYSGASFRHNNHPKLLYSVCEDVNNQ